MQKKNNNKGKNTPHKLSVPLLQDAIVDFFTQNPQMGLDAQQLGQQLGISNNRDSIQHVLEKLVDNKVLKTNGQGRYKLASAANEPAENADLSNLPPHISKREDVVVGSVDGTRTGSAYITDTGLSKDIFVPQGRMANALHGDKVAVRFWTSSRGRTEGEVVKVLQRHSDQFIGTLVVSRQYTFVMPDNPLMPYDILVDKNKLKGGVDGDKVLVSVKVWHTPKGEPSSPSGEIVKILGQSGVSDIEMQSILLENGFSLEFPDDVLRENDAILEEIQPQDLRGRRDFRGVTTFTIDPLTAKDFDDALSIQTYENGIIEIGVHIADVSHFVTQNSALDREAAKRTTSVYLVDRVLPMLPEKLSNGVCSLRPNEDKLTFSAVFEFNPEGDLVSEWFGKTVIHSNRRFTYEEAQEVLETGVGDYPKELKTLNEFAKKMRQERFKSGAFNFESPELRFQLDEKGKPIGVYTKVRKDAHFLVEEFMLLANKQVATHIQNHLKRSKLVVPFVYRIHDMPDMEKVETFVEFAKVFGYDVKVKNPKFVVQAFGKLLAECQGKPEQDILQQMAIRTMAKAAYSTQNIGHYGLAFENYSHFTSPIRRYADVLAHRILFEFLQKKPIRTQPDKLEESCQYISKKERKAMEAERASIKYKQVEFIQDHIGKSFEGVINGMNERGIFVEMRENRCEGMVGFDNMYDEFRLQKDGFKIASADRSYKMGDLVWVKVVSANLQKRQIELALLDERDFINTDEAAIAEAAEIAAELVANSNEETALVQKIEDTVARIETLDTNLPADSEENPAPAVEAPLSNTAYKKRQPIVQPIPEPLVEPTMDGHSAIGFADEPALETLETAIDNSKAEPIAETIIETPAEPIAETIVKTEKPATVKKGRTSKKPAELVIAEKPAEPIVAEKPAETAQETPKTAPKRSPKAKTVKSEKIEAPITTETPKTETAKKATSEKPKTEAVKKTGAKKSSAEKPNPVAENPAPPKTKQPKSSPKKPKNSDTEKKDENLG